MKMKFYNITQKMIFWKLIKVYIPLYQNKGPKYKYQFHKVLLILKKFKILKILKLSSALVTLAVVVGM